MYKTLRHISWLTPDWMNHCKIKLIADCNTADITSGELTVDDDSDTVEDRELLLERVFGGEKREDLEGFLRTSVCNANFLGFCCWSLWEKTNKENDKNTNLVGSTCKYRKSCISSVSKICRQRPFWHIRKNINF